MRKFLLILFCIVSNYITAQITSEDLASSKLGGSRKITIITPNGYDAKQKYPVFVVLNAHRLLEPTVSSMRYFMNLGEVPPCIIVGVYNNGTEVVVSEEVGVPFDESARFYEFVGQDVLPYVQKKFSTNNFKGIIADEHAANFINFYLLKEQSLFDVYLSLNPTLVSTTIEPLANQLETFKKPIFYYLAWTENEDLSKIQKVQQLHKAINSKDSEFLTYYSGSFSKVSPQGVAPSGIPEALNLFFSEYRPISIREYAEKLIKIDENIVEYLTDKYKNINTLYGIEKQPLIDDIRAVYAAIVRNGDWESLPILSDFVRKHYKNTSLPNYLEGEYFYHMKNPKRAFKSYQQAYALQEIDFVTKRAIEERLEETRKERKK